MRKERGAVRASKRHIVPFSLLKKREEENIFPMDVRPSVRTYIHSAAIQSQEERDGGGRNIKSHLLRRFHRHQVAPQWDSSAEDGKRGGEQSEKGLERGGGHNLCHSSVVLSHRTMVRVGVGGGGDVP